MDESLLSVYVHSLDITRVRESMQRLKFELVNTVGATWITKHIYSLSAIVV